MATYYVRKNANSVGKSGRVEPPDLSGLFYFFDGSDAAATDPNTVWTDETNTDDNDISTVGFTTTSGTESTAQVKIEGTDAPASGDTISSVLLYIYLGPGNVSTNTFFRVYTDGEGESLLNAGPAETPGQWQLLSSLNTPTGGWTWAKIQALELKFWQSSGTDRMEVAAVCVKVTTTAQGTKTTDPYRNVDEAASAVAAGDTVYIGAGVYRESVTVDASGSSGNLISFIGDVDGEQTGDPGPVIITAFENEGNLDNDRSNCLIFSDREFLFFSHIVFFGGASQAAQGFATGNIAYEEVTFEDCAFHTGFDETQGVVVIDVNQGATPTNAGPTFRRCLFVSGGVELRYDENATAEVNLKMTIENCLFIGAGSTSQGDSGFNHNLITSSSFHVGGISITNCTFFGVYTCISADDPTPATPTNKITVRNCFFAFSHNGLIKNTGDDGLIDSDYNTICAVTSPTTNVTLGDNDISMDHPPPFLGGIIDWPLYAKFGWSPYRPFEPVSLDGFTQPAPNALVGAADSAVAPATDLHENARPMRGFGIRRNTYYFDTSDAGPTDPDVAWTNDANAFDNDPTTTADTTTAGSETTNELRGEGTNAPATGGEILKVETRSYVGTTTGANMFFRIYTDGEAKSLQNWNTSGDDVWTNWAEPLAPDGGWTWAALQALEVIMWLGSGGTVGEVGAIQVRVTHYGGFTADDRGAIEARPQPVQETTTVRTGANSFKIPGAGYHDFLVPVNPQSTTVSIYGRFDSNYTGSKPILEVFNIPGVADQSDVMTVAANNWEQLTATFTPTAAGVVRVRVRSQDTSETGLTFFDDLTVV